METTLKYQKSIDMLNDALRHTITATLQYAYFHLRTENAGYEYLSRYLSEVCSIKIRHTEAIASRIFMLEGDADMNPSIPTRQADDTTEMLEIASATAKTAVDAANAFSIACADADDSVSQRLFQDIAADNERIAANLRNELQNLKDYGELYLSMQSIGRSRRIAKK